MRRLTEWNSLGDDESDSGDADNARNPNDVMLNGVGRQVVGATEQSDED